MDQGILVQVLFRTCKPTLAVRVWFSSYQQQSPVWQSLESKQIMILIFYINFVESKIIFSACILYSTRRGCTFCMSKKEQ